MAPCRSECRLRDFDLSASRTQSTEAGREQTGGFGIGDEEKPTFVAVRFAPVERLRTWLIAQR